MPSRPRNSAVTITRADGTAETRRPYNRQQLNQIRAHPGDLTTAEQARLYHECPTCSARPGRMCRKGNRRLHRPHPARLALVGA